MKNKKLIIGLSIGIVCLLLVVMGFGGILLYQFGRKKVKEIAKDNTQKTVAAKEKNTEEKSGVLDNLGVVSDKEENEEKTTEGSIPVVIDGYEFQIPNEYGCFIDDDGPVIYLDDEFYMRVVVRDDSFEEKCEKPEEFTKGAKESGGTITNDVKFTDIDGEKYSYFEYTDGEYDFVVCGCASTDKVKRFGGVMNKLSETAKVEDYVTIYAGVVSTAKATDQANTTSEELIEAQAQAERNASGAKKTESTLEVNGKKITYKVPEGLYSQYTDNSDSEARESFLDETYALMVDTAFMEKDWIEDAESYIQSEQGIYNDSFDNLSCSKVEKVTQDGHDFYYVMVSYDYKDSKYQKLIAACDINDQYIYIMDACGTDYDKELTLDSMKAFFTVQE